MEQLNISPKSMEHELLEIIVPIIKSIDNISNETNENILMKVQISLNEYCENIIASYKDIKYSLVKN